MSHNLHVYQGIKKVGQLSLDAAGRMRFQYAPQWLGAKRAIPLSLALPLRETAFEDVEARPFFANLLPESNLRRLIARKLGLSEQNDFALLEAVGGECAGAVSLLPNDQPPLSKGGYRALNDDELNALITELPSRPMLVGEQGVRLSLAGAQDKLPVLFDGVQISLPLNASPSSHILKPPIREYPGSVYNETFCMTLAQRVGLDVPTVTLLPKQQTLYLIQRYDRVTDPVSGLQRVHQEDFCQAMSIPPDQKYEKEGGPGLAQCFTLLREHSVQPVADMKALLNQVVFNYLIGNADAHGKNISLLLTDAGPRLAPFYDLMCTAIYPGLSQRQAMGIGGEDRPDWIVLRRWQQFATDTGIGFKLVRQTLQHMQQRLSAEAKVLADEMTREMSGEWPETDATITRIVQLIQARADKISRILASTAAGNNR